MLFDTVGATQTLSFLFSFAELRVNTLQTYDPTVAASEMKAMIHVASSTSTPFDQPPSPLACARGGAGSSRLPEREACIRQRT